MGAQESCGRTWHTFRICLLARYLILWYAGGPAKIFPTVFFPVINCIYFTLNSYTIITFYIYLLLLRIVYTVTLLNSCIILWQKRFFKLASCDCDSCSKCEFSHLTLTTRFQNIRSRTDQNHPATWFCLCFYTHSFYIYCFNTWAPLCMECVCKTILVAVNFLCTVFLRR